MLYMFFQRTSAADPCYIAIPVLKKILSNVFAYYATVVVDLAEVAGWGFIIGIPRPSCDISAGSFF